MELALPHLVIRLFGSGVGVELVAALTAHPVDVSEARDPPELHRVSGGRPPILVVVVDPQDTAAALREARACFPHVPVLVVSDSAAAGGPREHVAGAWIDAIRGSQSLQDICWHVMEAVSRAACLPDAAERPLGPVSIEVDARGIVMADAARVPGTLVDGRCLRPGDSFLSLVEPRDRGALVRFLGHPPGAEAEFFSVRLLNERGGRHAVSIGARGVRPGQFVLLVHPLISPSRRIGDRDPITGLLTRWAMSRVLDTGHAAGATGDRGTLLLLTIEDFAAIANLLGHGRTDDLLVRVASALTEIFPCPAISSRLMGDAFLAFTTETDADACRHRAEQLIEAVNAIVVPGGPPRLGLRASVGIATANGDDNDLALRLAEAAAAEARAAGGNRAVIAGSAEFSRAQAGELTDCMDLGSWEVWLQPVVRHGTDRIEFYESLARFDVGQGRMASRADFFTAGRAKGLLERFDRMMLQRALELLASQPEVRLSVNVTYESFMEESFPTTFLELIREVPRGCERIILEISPRCMAAPADVAERRLRALAAGGVAVALDDFGSGICRLRYLTQLPISMVKLDELVTGYVDDDPLQREFVRTVVGVCQARGITTVAEYTRSPDQLSRLVEDGVDLFQGELVGMPRPAGEVLSTCTPAPHP